MFVTPLPSSIYTHPLLPPSSDYYLDEITTDVTNITRIIVTAFIICVGGEVGVMASYPNGDSDCAVTHSFPENHTLECRDMIWLDPPLEFVL